MGKVSKARKIIEAGKFKLPSPAEIEAAKTHAGAWTAKQLAEWGVEWPPRRGWRQALRERWSNQQS